MSAALDGYRVLVVDTDSQATTTSMFGYVPDAEIDEDAIDPRAFFTDSDSDGYGAAGTAIFACTVPEGASARWP